jgi:hypothetical protein
MIKFSAGLSFIFEIIRKIEKNSSQKFRFDIKALSLLLDMLIHYVISVIWMTSIVIVLLLRL